MVCPCCGLTERHSPDCWHNQGPARLYPDVPQELRDRAACKDEIKRELALQAADEIDRLAADRTALRKFLMDATGEHPYPPDPGEHDGQTEDEAVESAKLTIMYDRKQWAEACEAIRAGKDWPQTHYPSKVDRWTVAAQKMELDRLTSALAAANERAERWKAEAMAARDAIGGLCADKAMDMGTLPENQNVRVASRNATLAWYAARTATDADRSSRQRAERLACESAARIIARADGDGELVRAMVWEIRDLVLRAWVAASKSLGWDR